MHWDTLFVQGSTPLSRNFVATVILDINPQHCNDLLSKKVFERGLISPVGVPCEVMSVASGSLAKPGPYN